MIRRIPGILRDFFATEVAGGVFLVMACIIALISANLPIHQQYFDFWQPAQAFINEGLMSIFFFLVGLEIRREFVDGEFRNPKAAALPILSAIGGMATTALIFSIINHGGPGITGWAIPMPTDIALSIGALALLGSRINISLKIFLLTLAIADDLGSILVLGIFYSHGINPVRIASTMGAVILAWVIPSGKKFSTERLIAYIHPWSSYLIIPLFALANIGVTVDLTSLGTLTSSPIAVGIIIGRVVGKLFGITLFAWLAVKLHLAKLPNSLSFKEIAGAGALAGMGLTVSLFIADLAFTNNEQLAQVKAGLIIAAIISAVLGLGMLRKFSVGRNGV
jgi:NhaA family Na+:H+ antiporter